MSFDDWTSEHHLTPNGWVKGTYKYYGKVQDEAVARPPGTIETWEEHCHQTSGWFPNTTNRVNSGTIQLGRTKIARSSARSFLHRSNRQTSNT